MSLYVSPAPHVHSNDTVRRNMLGVVVALLPTLFIGIYCFGLGAFVVLLTSVLSCLFFEYVITRYLLGKAPTLKDGSALVTGVLLACNLPSSISPFLVILGALVAIGIGKMSFGGLGCNIFNPALVGRVFLLISFPAQMTTWPLPQTAGRFLSMDVETGATPLSTWIGKSEGGVPIVDAFKKMLSPSVDYLQELWGNIGGSFGEVSAIAILLGLVFLLVTKVITWHIPVSIVVSASLLCLLLGVDPLFHILSGGMLLGAVFMATDYATSPMSSRGMLIYGAGIGILTMVIRLYGAYPEGMSFAILIMNAVTPLLNAYCKPKRFAN